MIMTGDKDMKKKLSIKDIAELAGISVSTVSRVINHKGRYSKETEKKINEIIKEYGYTRSQAAVSLRNTKSMIIALLVPDITNEFYSKIAFYLEKHLRKQGYMLFICNTENKVDVVQECIHELISKNVDGIISMVNINQFPKSFTNNPIPIVCIDVPCKDYPLICNDSYQIAYQCTQLFISKGRKSLIYIIPTDDELQNDIPQIKGFKQCLKDHSLSNKENVYRIPVRNTSYEDAESLVYQLLNQDSQIDGIICGSDKIALGALYAAKRLNKKIPEDILIIGNDHTLFSQLSSISTISRNRQELAEKAGNEIIKMNQDSSYKGKSYIVDFHIIERDSTKGI